MLNDSRTFKAVFDNEGFQCNICWSEGEVKFEESDS